ncbi:hypothetical protein [Pseudodesulfovibrio sediminis]|uniref:Uncharacterized protein n=1 Tax=Pseudodesulfovibrio sediminis TaxID=2810563 RepID=A0ABN6ESE5_9BACT|nr:hypothetical protein [Pseudodesulfovibrio sediminis]BCS87984.1 hypothetical protein PSDVSF_12260 [Pseudodesulfovibrio sediminis]
MRVHTFEHVPFEGPAALEEWAFVNGHTLTKTPVYANTRLPDPDDFDVLIVLGEPKSVHDEAEHPWCAVHLENTLRSMELLMNNCNSEIVDAPFVQDAKHMRFRVNECEQPRPLLDNLLNNHTKE